MLEALGLYSHRAEQGEHPGNLQSAPALLEQVFLSYLLGALTEMRPCSSPQTR